MSNTFLCAEHLTKYKNKFFYVYMHCIIFTIDHRCQEKNLRAIN